MRYPSSGAYAGFQRKQIDALAPSSVSQLARLHLPFAPPCVGCTTHNPFSTPTGHPKGRAKCLKPVHQSQHQSSTAQNTAPRRPNPAVYRSVRESRRRPRAIWQMIGATRLAMMTRRSRVLRHRPSAVCLSTCRSKVSGRIAFRLKSETAHFPPLAQDCAEQAQARGLRPTGTIPRLRLGIGLWTLARYRQ